MSKYSDKTNNEISLDIKQMELDYKMLKEKLVRTWDELIQMEADCAEAAKTITDRLKGVK